MKSEFEFQRILISIRSKKINILRSLRTLKVESTWSANKIDKTIFSFQLDMLC